MSGSGIDITQLETYLRYAESLDTASDKSFTEEELSKIWNLDPYRTKTLIRKLRKSGLVKRTRNGRYKLTLAGVVLVRIYKRMRIKR